MIKLPPDSRVTDGERGNDASGHRWRDRGSFWLLGRRRFDGFSRYSVSDRMELKIEVRIKALRSTSARNPVPRGYDSGRETDDGILR